MADAAPWELRRVCAADVRIVRSVRSVGTFSDTVAALTRGETHRDGDVYAAKDMD